MEQIERSGHGWIGLEKLPAEPLRAVDDAQHIESPAHGPGRARRQTPDVGRKEQQHRAALVELHGMATDAVAQVYRPRQGGGFAEGPVLQARHQAADAPDNHAGGEGAGEGCAGRALDAPDPLVDLDPDDRADQRARDGMGQRRMGVLQGVQRSRQPGSCDCPQGHRDEPARTNGRRRPGHGPLEPPPVKRPADQRADRPGQQVKDDVKRRVRRDVDHPARLGALRRLTRVPRSRAYRSPATQASSAAVSAMSPSYARVGTKGPICRGAAMATFCRVEA